MHNPYSEDELIEQPATALLAEMGWETLNCYSEFDRSDSSRGRQTKSEVVLTSRLQSALERLNPIATQEAIAKAIEDLTRSRSLMSDVEANREIYTLLKDGIRVTVSDPSGDGETTEVLQVIDWENIENNDFFAASQFWITGEMYTKRPDIICFVNGIPLVLMEFKRIDVNLYAAYNDNLQDYKQTIPHLFWYNAFILLSNGTDRPRQTRCLLAYTRQRKKYFNAVVCSEGPKKSAGKLDVCCRNRSQGIGRPDLQNLREYTWCFDAARGPCGKGRPSPSAAQRRPSLYLYPHNMLSSN